MLVGRRAETAVIDQLLTDAREGRSRALVVRGEAGIGKSALLAHAVERAEGMTVLRGLGIESESVLAFAGLHQLLRPLLGGIDALPEPQAAALRGAFALTSEAVDDRFKVALAVLGLLCEAAEERPVLCVVDDAQWLDQATVDALLFAVRRLEAERVAVLVAARDGAAAPFEAPALPELRLTGLEAADARLLVGGLLDPAGGAAVADWLVQHAHGNPLALIELAASGAEHRSVPPTTSVEETYLERINRLPADARVLLLVAAAEETGDRATIVRAAASLELDAGALELAEAEGFVHVGPETIEFRHPLVRSAAYRGAGFAERERAHAALAATLVGEADADRRAWHRAAATVGTDADVADELEQTATRARLRGGHGAAAEALARSSDLSADADERARRVVLAAGAANLAGHPARTIALVERAEAIVADPLQRADLARVRGAAELLHGRPAEVSRRLNDAAEAVAAHDGGRAIDLSVAAAEAAALGGDMEQLARAHAIGTSVEPDPADERQVLLSTLLNGGLLFFGEDRAGGAAIWRGALDDFRETDNPRDTFAVGVIASLLGDEERARPLYARAVTSARETGALGMLVHALTHQALRNFIAGFMPEAAEQADEAVRLARDLGAENSVAQPLAVLAWVAALQGRDDDCRRLVEEALDIARPRGLVMPPTIASWALAELELGHGRWEDALAGFEAFCDPRTGSGNPQVAIAAVPSLIEAAVRAGKPEAAAGYFGLFEAWAAATAAPFARPRLARCKALMAAAPDDAIGHFEDALREHAETGSSFEHGRTRLLYGELLRRLRRRTEARVHLRGALQTFESYGTPRWADRAQAELRATGETARRRDASTLGQLTPQELQIARLVGEGASNKEVAAQLFLSPRTVEYHLRKVFAKLGIASRAELIRQGVDAELAGVP